METNTPSSGHPATPRLPQWRSLSRTPLLKSLQHLLGRLNKIDRRSLLNVIANPHLVAIIVGFGTNVEVVHLAESVLHDGQERAVVFFFQDLDLVGRFAEQLDAEVVKARQPDLIGKVVGAQRDDVPIRRVRRAADETVRRRSGSV